MKVLVAGATGAIGRPLVALLQEAGHEVAAIARSEESLLALRDRGVEAHPADAFDRDAVIAACEAARPEVVVQQLTAIPHRLEPRKYRQQLELTGRLREEATPHLVEGARRAGARKVVAQSVSFLTAADGPPVVDEDAVADESNPVMGSTVRMERALLAQDDVEPLVLRYGYFYGPGTAYGPGGGMVEEIRRRRLPIVGSGEGRSSFVHVDDAAAATVVALDRGSGVLNVCDDDPAPMREWVPYVAELVGAKPPRKVPAWMARLAAGPQAVHFGERQRGNSNARAKAALGWAPARPSWREGFREVLA